MKRTTKTVTALILSAALLLPNLAAAAPGGHRGAPRGPARHAPARPGRPAPHHAPFHRPPPPRFHHHRPAPPPRFHHRPPPPPPRIIYHHDHCNDAIETVAGLAILGAVIGAAVSD